MCALASQPGPAERMDDRERSCPQACLWESPWPSTVLQRARERCTKCQGPRRSLGLRENLTAGGGGAGCWQEGRWLEIHHRNTRAPSERLRQGRGETSRPEQVRGQWCRAGKVALPSSSCGTTLPIALFAPSLARMEDEEAGGLYALQSKTSMLGKENPDMQPFCSYATGQRLVHGSQVPGEAKQRFFCGAQASCCGGVQHRGHSRLGHPRGQRL